MQILKSVWLFVLVATITGCAGRSDCTDAEQLTPLAADFSGVWKTSYGDVYFPKYTAGKVRGAFWSYPESNGKADNGRIIGSIDGRQLTGFWVEDSGDQPCESEKDGSAHWGPVHFEANDDFSIVSGAWGFCDKPPEGDDAGWVGTRE